MERVNIAVVAGHQLVRRGIRAVLTESSGAEIVYETDCGRSMMEFLEKQPGPDVLIFDLSIPNHSSSELDVMSILKERRRGMKTLALMNREENSLNSELARLEIDGLVFHGSAPKELIKAIHTITSGMFYLDSALSLPFRKWLTRTETSEIQAEDKLSSRELEVLGLICNEYTTAEISEKLNMAYDTVKGYRKRLFEKTNSRNVVGLVLYAVKNGYIEISLQPDPNSSP